MTTFVRPPKGLDPIERKEWGDDARRSLRDRQDLLAGKLLDAFESFKDRNEQRLSQIERKQEDIVTSMETDHVNQAVSAIQDQLGEVAAQLKELETNLSIGEMDRTAGQVAELATKVDAIQAQLDRPVIADPSAADGGTPLDPNAPTVMAGRRPQRLSPALERYRKQFNGWLRTGIFEGREVKEMSTLPESMRQMKALSTGSGPDAGFTIIPVIDQNVTRILSQVSDIRGIATVIQIAGNSYKATHITQGVDAGWVAETQSRLETTNIKMAELEFPTHELYAMPSATQTALDDSFLNLEQTISDEIAIKFNEKEGNAFVLGDGVGKPQGFLATDKVANGAWTWGSVGYVVTGAAGDFSQDDSPPDQADAIYSLIYALKSGYRNSGLTQEFGTNQGGDGAAVMLMNRTTEARVRKIKDRNGQYLWTPALDAAATTKLAGFTVVNAEDMPDIGADSYSIAFGNFRRGYLIVDRIGIRMLRDPYTAKPYVLFYSTKRVGGGVRDFDAIKLLKFGTA